MGIRCWIILCSLRMVSSVWRANEAVLTGSLDETVIKDEIINILVAGRDTVSV